MAETSSFKVDFYRKNVKETIHNLFTNILLGRLPCKVGLGTEKKKFLFFPEQLLAWLFSQCGAVKPNSRRVRDPTRSF